MFLANQVSLTEILEGGTTVARRLSGDKIVYVRAANAGEKQETSASAVATIYFKNGYESGGELGRMIVTTALASISTNAETLIALTESDSGATWYFNPAWFLRIDTSGSGSLLTIDSFHRSRQFTVDESPSVIATAVSSLVNAIGLPVGVMYTNTSNSLTGSFDMEIADTSNVSPTIRQKDVTNNPNALTLVNNGTGADIETDSLTLTDGKISPKTGVVAEIEVADTFNVAALTLDQNDSTNNPDVLVIENAGTGNDITAPNYSLNGGVLNVADGLVGAPSYSFTSDTDTGVYLLTPGQMGITVGGVLRATMQSDGMHIDEIRERVDGTGVFMVKAENPTGTNARKTLVCQYDFATDGGAVGSINLGETLPDKAIVTFSWFRVTTPITGGGGSTIALSIATDDVEGILAAAAIALAGTAGNHTGIQTGSLANFAEITTAERAILLEVGTDPLTAGAFTLFLDYVVVD